MRTYIYSCAIPRASTWLLTCPTTLVFHLSLAHFLTTLHTRLGLPHFSMAHLSQCKCDHIIDNLGTHLFQCLYRNEHTTTHNTFWDNVATIFLESGTHVQREVSHLFPRHTWHQMDILITRDSLWTLMDIVIAYSTHTNTKQRTSTMTTHVVMMTTQKKDTIIRWTNTKQWLHSPCYWDIWVSSFLFWFIFYHLCTYHYCTLSKVVFSPLNAWFLLSTTRFHNLATCTNHNDSLMNFCT
jgi:hypothetical protein